jgi:hypothetical protein
MPFNKFDDGTEIYPQYCYTNSKSSAGISSFCDNDQCYIYPNGTAKCIGTLESNGKINAFCTDNTGCQSKFSKDTHSIVLGNCLCGFNPTGAMHCDNFADDGYTDKYINFLNSWGESDDIQKCNVDIAYSADCIYSQGSKSMYSSFLYYQWMSEYQYALPGAQQCVLSVIMPSSVYRHHKSQ